MNVAPLTTSVDPAAPGPLSVPAAPPLAVSVHALSAAVPPLSFTTTLFSVKLGTLSSLVIVQTALCPLASAIEAPVCVPVPVQLQALAV